MALRYDRESRVYRGEQYAVSERTLNRLLLQLLNAGVEPDTALAQVLDERSWSESASGVRRLPRSRNCRHCHVGLPRRRRRYCSVVCEAESLLLELRSTLEGEN